MPSSPTDPLAGSDVAGAMARHPAGRLRHPGPAGVEPLAFVDAVALLTGPWRVRDPEGFAAAMTGAASIAGHQVVDAALGPGLDGTVVGAVAAAATRALAPRWVAGRHNGHLYVEARASAPAGLGGPEIFVVAHFVEQVSGGGRRAALTDHSWLVLFVGDGTGGIRFVLRATLACPAGARCCPRPDARIRLPLAALRQQLVRPAIEAELGPPASEGVVLAFPSMTTRGPSVCS